MNIQKQTFSPISIYCLVMCVLLLGPLPGGVVSDVLANEQDKPIAFGMPHIKRPNLVVKDIERSLAIYRDILGFEASTIRTGEAGSYSYPVFNVPEEASLRFVSLDEPSEERVLNLTEVTGIDLPTPQNAPHMSTVVIGVTDLAGIFERIAALGLKVTEPRIDQGEDFQFVEQAFVDFDGHLIVCYEVLAD